MTETPLPFFTRLWFAWACFFRVLFDGAFAARAFAARSPEALPAPAPTPAELPKREAKPSVTANDDAALTLLGLLQREGRLVDFVQQDISAFSDSDIGAAARVVHEGCRKALLSHIDIVPIRTEAEGARTSLNAGFDAAAIKLTGNVAGSGPFTGTLRHKGWRAEKVNLPKLVAGHDARVLAPAEVEL